MQFEDSGEEQRAKTVKLEEIPMNIKEEAKSDGNEEEEEEKRNTTKPGIKQNWRENEDEFIISLVE